MDKQEKPATLYTPAEGWERYIDQCFSDKGVRGFNAVTKGLPLILKELGCKKKNIVFKYKKKYEQKHPEVTKQILKQLPRKLADPIAIFDSQEIKNALTVFTDIPIGNECIMVAIHLDRKIGSHNIHNIASTYARNNTVKKIYDWSHDKKARYIDERRVSELFVATKGNHTTSGLQLPIWEQLTNSHNHKVILKSELVKKYPEAFGICPEESLTPQVEKSPIPKHNQVQKTPIPNIDFSTSKRQQKMLGIKR